MRIITIEYAGSNWETIMLLRTLVWVSAIATPSFASNQVLIVGPGAEFTSLQAAIDAATDGDVILCREGHHGSAVVDGKGISIVADDPTDSGFHRIGSIEIRNVPQGAVTLVRGFQFSDFSLLQAFPRIRVDSNAGAVILEDNQADKSRIAAAEVTSSAAVVFTRCVLEGAKGNSMIGLAGAPALRGIQSTIHAYDSVFAGGDGGNDFSPDQLYGGAPTNGGAGAEVVGGSLFVSGTTLSGGDGGDLISGLFGGDHGGDGGAGVVLTGGALLRRLNSPALAGPAGTPDLPQYGEPGNPGEPLVVIDGAVASIPEFARKLEITSPVREGESTTLSLTGQPNEPVWLLFSLDAQPFFASSLRGALIPALPVTLLSLGQQNGSGNLALPVSIPNSILPPGVEAVVVHVQVMLAGSSGPILLSSPSALFVLDDAL